MATPLASLAWTAQKASATRSKQALARPGSARQWERGSASQQRPAGRALRTVPALMRDFVSQNFVSQKASAPLMAWRLRLAPLMAWLLGWVMGYARVQVAPAALALRSESSRMSVSPPV